MNCGVSLRLAFALRLPQQLQVGALTQRTLTERAPGARSWGAPRARRGPGVEPTTVAEQDRQIRAPPPTSVDCAATLH